MMMMLETQQQSSNNNLPTRKSRDNIEVIKRHVTQLMVVCYEIDVGINKARRLCEVHFTNNDECFGFFVTDAVDDTCSFITQLINVENSIVNIIEQYQYYLEQYTTISMPPSPSPSSSFSFAESCNSQQFDPATRSDKKFILQQLEVDSHIDRICQCARVFESLRKTLIDSDQLSEIKVLFQDVVAITGHDPLRRKSNDERNYLFALEKIYYKFQQKMKEYEVVVHNLSKV